MTELQNELQAITEALGTLAQHMDESLPEERMRELVSATIAEEKRGRVRLVVAVVSPLLIVLAVALATLAQSSANHRQGQSIQRTAADAKVVADYVRTCLETPVAQRDPVKCGLDGQADVVKGLVKLIGCDIRALPDATQAKLDACATEAFSR